MGCKKTSYGTEEFALKHIEIINKKSNRSLTPKSVYFCKKCNTWHITKQESVEYLKRQLAENNELLKSREEELFKVKIMLKNIENLRNNSLGTNDFQIKIRILEKKLEKEKALRASYGSKFQDINSKLNAIKVLVKNAIKKDYSLNEFLGKIKEKCE